MGKTTVEKRRKRHQDPIKKGTIVYFLGFTKDKKVGPTNYMCKAVVVESPSPFNKAPHKVEIIAVGPSKFHIGGTEEDAKTLIGKVIHLPIEKLNPELQVWLTPSIWWV